MPGDNEDRGTADRKSSTPVLRGVANPHKLHPRCYKHIVKVPETLEAFESQIEKWIATCVMSRTEFNRVPMQRERELVVGNPSLRTIYGILRDLKETEATIKAEYIWSDFRVETIIFSAVTSGKVAEPWTTRATTSPADPGRRLTKPAEITQPPTAPDRKSKVEPLNPQILVDPPLRPAKFQPGKYKLKDIIRYAKDLLLVFEKTLTKPDPKHIERLRNALEKVEDLMMVMSSIIGLLVWDSVTKQLIVIKSWELDYAELRAMSRFDRSGTIQELEKALTDLESVIDEAVENSQIPPSETIIRVSPTVRGFAIEDFHIDLRLSDQGYQSLRQINNWRGVDTIRGNYVKVNRDGRTIKLYKNPDAVSIKSTEVTKPKNLLEKFENDWLPPLQGRYVHEQEGIRIEGLGKKELHLIFEEGAVFFLTPSDWKLLKEAFKRMGKIATGSHVKFKWFVFSGGHEFEGTEYLKKLKLDQE